MNTPALAFAAGFLALVGGVFAPPVEAASICGDRATIIKGLGQKHSETPVATGLSADGGVLEILASPEGGWTILITYPKRPTCVIAVGEAWELIHHLAGQSA